MRKRRNGKILARRASGLRSPRSRPPTSCSTRAAADVIVDEASAFLGRARAELHLMLVDLSDESDIVRRVRGAAERRGLETGFGKEV